MQEEILKRVDLLAQKLGTTAMHLFNVLCYQARIELVFDILYMIIGFATLFLSIKIGLKKIEECGLHYDKKPKEWNETRAISIIILSVILGLTGLVIGIVNSVAIPNVINPENYVFHQIVGR